MRILFLAWQDPAGRSWFPIGRLRFDGRCYEFVYVQGAARALGTAGFRPLQSFPRFEDTYVSDELFPFFSNRVMPSARLDYAEFLTALNLPRDEADPIALLAVSGGRRETDAFELFPKPERKPDGAYHIRFFAHGLRHLPGSSVHRLERLSEGERLFLMADLQNPFDYRALAMRTDDRHIVGYCPRHLVEDLFRVVVESEPQATLVEVEKVNRPPAPLQLRLLCGLTGRWPSGFEPFTGDAFKPLAVPYAEVTFDEFGRPVASARPVR